MDILQISLLGFVVFVASISRAGFGAGATTLVVPLLSLVMPVSKAAAITLPIFILMDVVNVRHYRSDIDFSIIKLLLPSGIVGIVLGGLLFNLFTNDEAALKQGLGALVLVFLLFQLGRTVIMGKLTAFNPPRWFGAIMGIVAGFTSTIAHAGGPPAFIYIMPQQLTKERFAATVIGLFFGLNLVKLIPYQLLGLLNIGDVRSILLVLPMALLGTFAGQWLVKTVDERPFTIILYIILILTAIQLLLGINLFSLFLG